MVNYFIYLIHQLLGSYMTPTVLRIGAYRFFFYSGDRVEPSHIHVEREKFVAKFWLEPVRLQRSGGFRANEIRRIQRIIEEHQEQLLESWYENFDT
jgi:hypothetical protein